MVGIDANVSFIWRKCDFIQFLRGHLRSHPILDFHYFVCVHVPAVGFWTDTEKYAAKPTKVQYDG